MPKVIALDYGVKRTGIATTDDLQLIASGLKTVATSELFTFLTQFFQSETVERVLIGLPKQMNGAPSESTYIIEDFVAKFKQTFSIPIEFRDERFTSKMAFQSLIDSGLKKKQRQNKALVDEVAATIILQDYLLQKK